MQGTPYTYVDGIIEKVGAFGNTSSCKGDNDSCTYNYFMGIDSAACKLQNNPGVLDRQPIASPLFIAIQSLYDAGTLGGTLTVTVKLDGSIAPASGTINLITVVLYERGVESGYGTPPDPIWYPQVVRASLLTSQVNVTEAGQEQTFTVNYLLDPSWHPEDMGALAFVQNYTGSTSTDPKKLAPLEIYNSGFLASLTQPPPSSTHLRPVSKP